MLVITYRYLWDVETQPLAYLVFLLYNDWLESSRVKNSDLYVSGFGLFPLSSRHRNV